MFVRLAVEALCLPPCGRWWAFRLVVRVWRWTWQGRLRAASWWLRRLGPRLRLAWLRTEVRVGRWRSGCRGVRGATMSDDSKAPAELQQYLTLSMMALCDLGLNRAAVTEFLEAQRAKGLPIHPEVQRLLDRHFPDPDDDSVEARDVRYWAEAFGDHPFRFFDWGSHCYAVHWLRGEYPRWRDLQLDLYEFLHGGVGVDERVH